MCGQKMPPFFANAGYLKPYSEDPGLALLPNICSLRSEPVPQPPAVAGCAQEARQERLIGLAADAQTVGRSGRHVPRPRWRLYGY
jgi:hypothetical protein